MFAEANLPDAGSLASMSDQALAYDDVAKELIAHLDQQYHLLLEGNIQTLESHWQGRLDLLGKNVIAETVNDIHRGRLTDVAFAGVNILTDSDEIVRLSPESIRQLRTES